MSPIDEFTYIKQNKIVYDSNSLIQLYFPIMGSDAMALYDYFVHFFDDGIRRHKFSEVLNHLQYGMPRFQDALVMLTALDLLTVYQATGTYLVKLNQAMSNELFLSNPIYRHLLEKRIGEVAVAELDMKIPKNARDISKKFTDVFSDLGQPKQEVNRSKNVFDLESFKRLMMRDGLRFNNEKDDVLGIYSVSELYHLNWYDTYQLAKQTAINGMIAPQRMKVQQNEGQHIKDNQSFTNNEKVILRESKNDSALVFLEKIKRSRKAVTTSGEKTLLEDLAKMNFLDEVINVMVLYTLNKTKSANLNKAYIMKVANDFAFQNVMTAEDAVLKIRDFSDQKVRTKTETKKKQSNVPEWSNPDYKDEVSPEKEIELEQFKTDALKRLERLGKDGES